MDIYKIIKKVKKIFIEKHKILIPAFYIINCVTLLTQISSSGIVAIAIQLMLVTLPHGFIHMILMLIHEDVDTFDLKDNFIGISKFSQFFPAYFVREVIIVCSCGLFLIPIIWIVYNNSSQNLYAIVDVAIYIIFSNALRLDFISYFTNFFNIGTVFFLSLAILVYVFLSLKFLLVPCIVEDYDYAWNEALVKSVQMMKGRSIEFIKIWISLLPSYLMYLLLSLFALSICNIVPVVGFSLYLIISMLIYISTYQVKFYTAIALFYIELRNENNPHELFRI